MEKQVNRRVADSRHDVQESFTVEHRLHEKSLPVVWRKEWGFCLLGQTMICGRIAIGRDRWELCSYATRFVLRLGRNQLASVGMQESVSLNCAMRWTRPCRIKGMGCLSLR